MVVMPLGGGQEVGRSCILLQYQNRNILLDCGCHPGRDGDDSLPFFDALSNPGEIDLILITHFHIDHCAALPYFTERTDFKGKIYMTHPTKAVMKLLLSDNIRLQSKQGLYNEQVTRRVALLVAVAVADAVARLCCRRICKTVSTRST